jgi:hypothetical protein
MDLIAWALYAFVTVVVLLGTALHYRRREPAGRGRYVLAGLRAAALSVLILLLFDPLIPAGRAAGGVSTVVLVDASLSMRLPAPDGTTRWDEARRIVADTRPETILVFGSAEARRVSSLDDVSPDQPSTRLGPALRSALEAGADRVVVVTDGAVQDMEEALRVAGTAGGRVEMHRVGERTAGNLGIVEMTTPGWARSDEETTVRVALGRVGAAVPDSVTVTLRWADRELARARAATPPEGRVSPLTLRFVPPPGMAGLVRLEAVLEEADVEPADDRRSAYVRIAEQPAGIVLVSFSADQEPRFLLPVLARALGLESRGWLALGPNRFVRVGLGTEAGRSDTEAEVRSAVAGADLVVLHGLSQDAPTWARTAMANTPRVLVFPREPVPALPVEPGPVRPGDWYPDDEVPASPIAPFLAATGVGPAPPLTGIRVAGEGRGWWAPLYARQDRRGEPRPVLIAGQVGARRVAIALAEGYWRWAFGDDEDRPLYDALWAGLGAWLVADSPTRELAEVRPESRVVARSEPIRWIAPPDADSLRVTLHPLADTERSPAQDAGREDLAPVPPEAAAAGALDTVVLAEAGTAMQTAPAPGHYRYEARALLATGEAVQGAGELTIERYSDEFTRPARPFDRFDGDAEPAVRDAARHGRPLRAVAWPYVAVVLLLSAEWVLRRRWGLR